MKYSGILYQNSAGIIASPNGKPRKDQPREYQELSDEELDLEQCIRHRSRLLLRCCSRFHDRGVLRRGLPRLWPSGACISPQKQPDGNDKTIGYWSRLLTDVGWAFDTTFREGLGVIWVLWAVILLYPCLEGTHLIIKTEHDGLRWILNLADATVKFIHGAPDCLRCRLTSFMAREVSIKQLMPYREYLPDRRITRQSTTCYR